MTQGTHRLGGIKRNIAIFYLPKAISRKRCKIC